MFRNKNPVDCGFRMEWLTIVALSLNKPSSPTHPLPSDQTLTLPAGYDFLVLLRLNGIQIEPQQYLDKTVRTTKG